MGEGAQWRTSGVAVSREKGGVVVAPVLETGVGWYVEEGGEVWDVGGQNRIGRCKLKFIIYLLN